MKRKKPSFTFLFFILSLCQKYSTNKLIHLQKKKHDYWLMNLSKIITSEESLFLMRISSTSISSFWNAGLDADPADSNTVSSMVESSWVDSERASWTCLARRSRDRSSPRDVDGRGEDAEDGLKVEAMGADEESIELLNCPKIRSWRETEFGSVTWERSLVW